MNRKSVLGSRKDSLFRTTDERSSDVLNEDMLPSEGRSPDKTSDDGKRVSIVLYDDEIRFLDESLYKLKMKGFRSASKSKIIRFALDQIKDMDIDDYVIK